MGRKNRRKHYNNYGGMERMVYTNEQAKAILHTPSDLQWLSHQTVNGRRYSDKDVSISLCKKGERIAERFSVTFRNGVTEHFGERVDVAIYKNRVFFKTGSPTTGYKFYIGTKKNPSIQINRNEQSKALDEFVGDYDLKYDEFYELYYIERE